MRIARLAAGLVVVLVMIGCATGSINESPAPGPAAAPSRQPTPGPTPEPTVDPRVTTAVFFGDRIEWRNAAGAAVDTTRFNVDGQVFRLHLERHLGPPDPDQPMCAAYAYGDSLSVSEWAPGVIEVFVTAPEVNGIRFETPSGVSVGDEAIDLFEATPAEHRFDSSSITPDFPAWKLMYDQTGTVAEGFPEPKPYGAGALVRDMLIQGFGHMTVGHVVDYC